VRRGNDDLLDRVARKVEAEQEALVRLLQEMIRIPSVTGDEKNLARYCLEKMRDLGLETDTWEPDVQMLQQHPEFAPNATSFKGRPNVVGRLRGAGGGRSLILNGHLDVVAPGSRDLWSYGPWSGDVAQGRVYGRGANDMKAGLAISLMAVQWLRDMGIDLRGDLILQFVVDEELGGNGTLSAILRGYTADGALQLEPTGMGNIIVGHRGSLAFQVTTGGRPVAWENRGKGENAINNIAVIIDAIRHFGEQRRRSASHPRFAEYENPVPVYVGTVHGGYWIAANPLRCTVEGVIGWLPGETIEQVKREFVDTLLEITSQDARYRGRPPQVTFPAHHIRPCLVDEGHPIVAAVQEAARTILHREPCLKVNNGGSDQWLLHTCGHTPTVQVGVSLCNAHSPYEDVQTEELVAVAKIVLLAVMAWCGVEGATARG